MQTSSSRKYATSLNIRERFTSLSALEKNCFSFKILNALREKSRSLSG